MHSSVQILMFNLREACSFQAELPEDAPVRILCHQNRQLHLGPKGSKTRCFRAKHFGMDIDPDAVYDTKGCTTETYVIWIFKVVLRCFTGKPQLSAEVQTAPWLRCAFLHQCIANRHQRRFADGCHMASSSVGHRGQNIRCSNLAIETVEHQFGISCSNWNQLMKPPVFFDILPCPDGFGHRTSAGGEWWCAQTLLLESECCEECLGHWKVWLDPLDACTKRSTSLCFSSLFLGTLFFFGLFFENFSTTPSASFKPHRPQLNLENWWPPGWTAMPSSWILDVPLTRSSRCIASWCSKTPRTGGSPEVTKHDKTIQNDTKPSQTIQNFAKPYKTHVFWRSIFWCQTRWWYLGGETTCGLRSKPLRGVSLASRGRTRSSSVDMSGIHWPQWEVGGKPISLLCGLVVAGIFLTSRHWQNWFWIQPGGQWSCRTCGIACSIHWGSVADLCSWFNRFHSWDHNGGRHTIPIEFRYICGGSCWKCVDPQRNWLMSPSFWIPPDGLDV